MDWFTIANVVVLGDGDESLAWSTKDAALVVFDAPVRGEWRTAFERRSGTILSWVTNNYWWTNTLPTQQGNVDLSYRFAPSRHSEAAVRMGRELRSELWTSEVTVADRRDPWSRPRAASGSLWNVEAPEHVEVTVFASRFHEGAALVRLQEFAHRPGDVILPRLPGADGRVMECTDVEDETASVGTAAGEPLSIHLGPSQVRSFLFFPEDSA